MDLATMTRVHDLAAVYGGVGLEQDENNLNCPLCTENKQLTWVVQVVRDFRPEFTNFMRSGRVNASPYERATFTL